MFYSNRFHYGLSPDNITLYGEHTEKLSIDIRPELLSTADREKLYRATINASQEVRSYNPRTIYGPVEAALRNFDAFATGKATHLTLIQDAAFVGGKTTFRGGLPATFDHPSLEETVRKNKLTIAKNT